MASTTFIDNQTTIYAAWLNDVNSAVYNGTFQSSTITATSMVCTGTASGAGFTNLINNALSSPGAIGGATPNTGAFTTLTSTSLATTTITGLTTPLSRAQGGTGLSAAGTAGNILTSNGTNWTSAAPAAIGVGQTWQNVTGSRAAGTTYTNSTGKPIQIIISALANDANTWYTYVYVDGVQVVFAYGGGGAGSYYYLPSSVIVPAGSTYSVTNVGGIYIWAELR
jgi:hypothetical protein